MAAKDGRYIFFLAQVPPPASPSATQRYGGDDGGERWRVCVRCNSFCWCCVHAAVEQRHWNHHGGARSKHGGVRIRHVPRVDPRVRYAEKQGREGDRGREGLAHACQCARCVLTLLSFFSFFYWAKKRSVFGVGVRAGRDAASAWDHVPPKQVRCLVVALSSPLSLPCRARRRAISPGVACCPLASRVLPWRRSSWPF